MTPPTDKSGDSTPNFDWVHDPDPESTEFGDLPPGSDSATSLLPPAEDPTPVFVPRAEPEGPAEPVPAPEEPPLDETAPMFRVPSAGGTLDRTDEDEATDVLVGGGGDEEPLPSLTDVVPEPATTVPPVPAPAPRLNSNRTALLLIVLVSYASAVTIALVYLYARLRSPNPHVLESLPDVPPLKQGEVQIVPVDAPMPTGHTLRLGESQRFGNLLVEPLQVVRGPAEFVHFSGDSGEQHESTGPILRLWLRFTNVASHQSIAPLDPHLVFARHFGRQGTTAAKNFVCRAADKSGGGPLVFLYDHPETSEWDFSGQQLGRLLQPGESFDTFLPSAEEGLEQLTGELLWRVHFRKGYSPRGYGVTTLIEVAFREEEIGTSARDPQG